MVLTGCVGAVYTVAAEHGTAGVSDASTTDKVSNSITNIDQADYGPSLAAIPDVSCLGPPPNYDAPTVTAQTTASVIGLV
jgi:hypothetical protein